MVVLDTHVWVWWIGGPGAPPLSRKARAAIDTADRIGVCDISQVEIAWLVQHGRVRLDRPVALWLHQALERARVVGLRIEPAIAAAAAAIDWSHKDPADRLIVASAQAHHAPLVTRDRAIRSYQGVATIW